jgi:hypothetical protein
MNYDSYSAPSVTYSVVKTTPFTALRGRLDKIAATSPGGYGQSVGVFFSEAELVDGALYVDVESAPDRPSFKMFSFDELKADGPDDAPETYTATYPNGEKEYQLVAARRGPSEPGADDADPAEPVPIDEGTVVVFEGGSTKPSATAKSTVQVLGNMGGAAILDPNNAMNWLDQAVELRADLQGRLVELAKVEKTMKVDAPGGGSREVTFHSPIVYDVETARLITPATTFDGEGGEGGQDGPQAAPSDEGEETVAATTDGGVAAPAASEANPVQSIVDTFVDMNVSDDGLIRRQLASLVSAADHPITEEHVENFGGEEAVVEAIQHALR